MNKVINDLTAYTRELDETAILDEITHGEVPPIDKGFSTSTREKYYKELNIKWEASSNTVVGEDIWSRTYTELVFDEDEPVYIKEVKEEEYDLEKGGNDFYRVNHCFSEDSYKANKPFFRWSRERMLWYQEIYYHDRKSSVIRWDRPFTSYDNPDSTSTKHYQQLPPVFTRTLDCGKALGVVIRSDALFDLQIGDSLYKGIRESHKISPLSEPLITLTFRNITNHSLSQSYTTRYENEVQISDTWYNVFPIEVYPKYIEVDIYGTEEASRSYHPKGEDEDYREILIHSQSTPYRERLVPPGKSSQFDANFWNIEDMQVTSKRYKNYNHRRDKEPTWQ